MKLVILESPYTDLGVSGGMENAIHSATIVGLPVLFRTLIDNKYNPQVR